MTNTRDDILSHICVETHQNTTTTIQGGYRQDLLEHNLTPLEASSVLCCSCEGVMRVPFFTDKGYKCRSCLYGAEGREASVNKSEIDKLMVHCPFKKEGCGWVRNVKLLISHVEECELCPVLCPLGCGLCLERKGLDTHTNEDCQERSTICEFCEISFKVSQLTLHFETCPKFPLECTNGCDTDRIARQDMDTHVSELCPLSTVPCPFNKYGCAVLGKRKDVESHETEFVVKHVRLMNTHIDGQNTHISRLNADITGLNTDLDEMNKHQIMMGEAIQMNKGLKWEIKGIGEKFENKEKLFSVPFYVNNYKFQSSVCFDTDNNQALGIFVYLCVGVLDDSLKWPFLGEVIITLKNPRNHFPLRTKSFLTNKIENLACFTRRTTNAGGWGYPSFATKHAILTEFSKDDTILVQIEIQHEDTPVGFKVLTS